MIQNTSLRAYFGEVMETLGVRQKTVLEALSKRPNFTNSELSQYLNWPINTVTPRIHELREKGLVQMAGERKCNVTGRKVIAWELKDKEDGNIKLFI